MPVLHLRRPYEGPPLEQLQLELRGYIRQLTAQLGKQTNRRAGKSNGPSVYLSMFSRKWNEPRREGPYKVIRVTLTAVQVEGSVMWYHLNHCSRVPNSGYEGPFDAPQRSRGQAPGRIRDRGPKKKFPR